MAELLLILHHHSLLHHGVRITKKWSHAHSRHGFNTWTSVGHRHHLVVLLVLYHLLLHHGMVHLH